MWFLNVQMARSAAFCRCILGGVIYYAFLCFFMAIFESLLYKTKKMWYVHALEDVDAGYPMHLQYF